MSFILLIPFISVDTISNLSIHIATSGLNTMPIQHYEEIAEHVKNNIAKDHEKIDTFIKECYKDESIDHVKLQYKYDIINQLNSKNWPTYYIPKAAISYDHDIIPFKLTEELNQQIFNDNDFDKFIVESIMNQYLYNTDISSTLQQHYIKYMKQRLLNDDIISKEEEVSPVILKPNVKESKQSMGANTILANEPPTEIKNENNPANNRDLDSLQLKDSLRSETKTKQSFDQTNNVDESINDSNPLPSTVNSESTNLDENSKEVNTSGNNLIKKVKTVNRKQILTSIALLGGLSTIGLVAALSNDNTNITSQNNTEDIYDNNSYNTYTHMSLLL